MTGRIRPGVRVKKRPIVFWSSRRVRFMLWRHRWFPYRICVPWQPVVAEDGPYKAWRWRGRELFKSPWSEGRTRETYMKYAAMYPNIARSSYIPSEHRHPEGDE